MYKTTQIIAEVKTQSPFGFRSEKSWDELFQIADEFGDMISIHTDPRWGGSFDLVRKAKELTKKSGRNRPILAKGIHATDDLIEQALDAGADYVLVVGRVPATSVGSKIQLDRCMIEPNTIAELMKLPAGVRAVWNARDLTTGQAKKETFVRARTAFSGWLCQASFVKSVEDIQEGADAVLVGESLCAFEQSLKNKDFDVK